MGTVNLGRVRDRVTGVERINGNGSAGTIDTYRVSFESSNYYDFNVTNGRNGVGQIVSFSGNSNSKNDLIVRIVDNQDKVLALLVKSSEQNNGYMQASFKVEKTAESTDEHGLVTTSTYAVYAYDPTGSQLFFATCKLSNLAAFSPVVTFTYSSGFEACLNAWCILYYNDSSTGITVDDELSDNSTNPVQNKAVTGEFNKLGNDVKEHFASINHEKNYLDINSCIGGYYVNYSNGNLYENADLKVTQFIELKSNTDYCLANLNMDQQQYNLGQMAFYDENQNYISGETNSGLRTTTFNTGANIKYVRVSLPMQLTMVQLEEGTTSTTFENYHKCIDNDLLSYLYQDRINKIPQLVTDVNNLKPKVVTVGSGGDYSTILQAILSTTPDVAIHVLSGVYNIVEEYKTVYGNDFWDNYTDYFNKPATYRGLYLENGREIYGDGDTVLTFFYDGNNENVNLYFSVLAPTYDNYIHDLTISISTDSCRYAIHDDFASRKGTIKYERLILSGSPKADALIGAGCGQDNVYVIKDCVFINNTKLHDISYHGNAGSTGASRIVVSGCMGSQKCAFRWLGTSTQITYITASNNKFGKISCEAYDTSATVRNMEMFAFNNTETNS